MPHHGKSRARQISAEEAKKAPDAAIVEMADTPPLRSDVRFKLDERTGWPVVKNT
jgi:hypothetical protein